MTNILTISFICICLVLLTFIAVQNKFLYIFKFAVRSFLGIVGIMAANSFGLLVGVNVVTVSFIGLLGIPAYLSLIILQYFL